jgi:hypothetical protein
MKSQLKNNMDKPDFITAERERALNLFGTRHKPGFKNKTAFADWFIDQLLEQNLSCHYCETSIFEIKLLIDKGLLKKRKTRYGWRGSVLEVDKKSNHLGYSCENRVLSCYYCNNDKSYTLDSEAYKRFFGPNRKMFFEYLASGKQVY